MLLVCPGGVTTHAVMTMCDKKKGSMTNRFECAKEHVKNDVKSGLKLAVPTAAVAGAAYIKYAKPASKAAQLMTKGLGTIGKCIGKVANKVAPKFAKEIMKNPAKFGAIGLAVAAGGYALDTIFAWANKKGRIDQKYEDAAKIESQTKNIILESQLAKANAANLVQ